MTTEKDFLAYSNSDIKTVELDELVNQYCDLVLTNGFSYTGILLSVEDTYVIFMDRRDGTRQFYKEKIFVCYKRKKPTNKKEPEDYK